MIMLLFFFDISALSNFDLNLPKIEVVTSITNLERREKGTMMDLSFFKMNNVKMDEFSKFVGTTFISKPEVNTTTVSDGQEDFYTFNYDLVVKLPVFKTLKKKIHIGTISKFTPKIVL